MNCGNGKVSIFLDCVLEDAKLFSQSGFVRKGMMEQMMAKSMKIIKKKNAKRKKKLGIKVTRYKGN
jgi:hypothetical protein